MEVRSFAASGSTLDGNRLLRALSKMARTPVTIRVECNCPSRLELQRLRAALAPYCRIDTLRASTGVRGHFLTRAVALS